MNYLFVFAIPSAGINLGKRENGRVAAWIESLVTQMKQGIIAAARREDLAEEKKGKRKRWDDRLERRENRDTPLACLLLFEQQTDKIRLFCFLVDIVTNRTFVCKSFPEHLISLVLALVLYPNKTYLFLDDICSICLLNKVSLQLVFFAMGSTVVYR